MTALSWFALLIIATAIITAVVTLVRQNKAAKQRQQAPARRNPVVDAVEGDDMPTVPEVPATGYSRRSTLRRESDTAARVRRGREVRESVAADDSGADLAILAATQFPAADSTPAPAPAPACDPPPHSSGGDVGSGGYSGGDTSTSGGDGGGGGGGDAGC